VSLFETYFDAAGAERHDECDEPVFDCQCICIDCGDPLSECACEEGDGNDE
jgi:hypothetical protein